MLFRKISLSVSLVLLPWLALASAPDITLKDFDGRSRNVAEFIGKGKWTVVAVWAHDCHICNEEIHHMVDFHKAHQRKSAAVLGVTIDGEEKKHLARKFLDKHKLNFPNLIAEPDAELLASFGGGRFVGTPTYYIYTPKGEIVARNIGPVTREEIETFIKEYRE